MLKKILKGKRKAVMVVSGVVTSMCLQGAVFASEYTPKSLMDEQVKTMVSNFGADVQFTTVELICILVPIGIALWGIGFAVGKGLNWIQRKAAKALRA